MQRYTFQLSVGNKIKVKMDSSDVKDEVPVQRDMVKNIAENFEKQRKLQNTDTDRKPLYTTEEEAKLLEKYKSMSNGKLDIYLKFFKQADKDNLGFLTVHQFAEAVRKRGFKGKDWEITVRMK
ncbi:hypothetical protein FSP39_020410 [Pinctada imbricata]|uniref:EF-hand domain-containing protein n=1 Tax=Pinctada imbricata TaxID=66713 RepID=A0AA88YXN4_PINIB|nr:hypothetical protein FSP39_020410 [Pinctada imbricata]